MPTVDDTPQTHYPGCWREHHECAVKLIEAAERIISAVFLEDARPSDRMFWWLFRAGYKPPEPPKSDGK